jgi:hypothetical protein
VKLIFERTQHPSRMIAYGKSHDYVIDLDERMGYVGKYAAGLLDKVEVKPIDSEAYASIPDATREQLIRTAEEWESK